MACDSPYRVIKAGEKIGQKVYNEDINVPCGKCPPCKLRRVQEWVFRLLIEERHSFSSYFITLTYDTQHVPITKNGFMTLDKRDVQLFMKRLRKHNSAKLTYYTAGEYGDQKYRPHYHMILFNLEDQESIFKAWDLGDVHIGKVTGDSIAYTAKYIDKQKRIPLHRNDDRVKEFSLMSKGIGKQFLTDQMVKYYKNDVSRNHVVKGSGHIEALPRYYRNKIFTDQEKEDQRKYILQYIEDKEKLSKREFEKNYPDIDSSFEEYKELAKFGRYHKFYNKNKKKRT